MDGSGSDSLAERISTELVRWDGVTAEPHRFGGVEFRLGANVGWATCTGTGSPTSRSSAGFER